MIIVKHYSLLFGNNSDGCVLERKKSWLMQKLKESCSNFGECEKVLNIVVNVLTDFKLEFIIEFLKMNIEIDKFKKIFLFPQFNTWVGSEIPLILEKIDFLRQLKENLKGIEYLEHRKYIEDCIFNLEKEKGRVEEKEYIENNAYA